jgi:serine/threonine protein kinase
MDAARWEQVQELFHAALAQPATLRVTFVRSGCADDRDLETEVLDMLHADGAGSSLLDRDLSQLAASFLAPSEPELPQQEFGPYQLIRILGEGGMGVVWLARRKDADNLVAVKFLPHARLSPARLARFTDEIKTLGKLRHPYIARFYDAGTLADGTPWFVMEYVEGLPMTEYCSQHQLDAEATLRLFRCVCEAVQYAHGQEVIHRDLKPSNILVEKDATPRLLDFGIAKQLHNLKDAAERTQPEFRFMTSDYAAPEWKYDGVVGFRTDVYSLGVILYQLLAGRLPYPHGDAGKEAVRREEQAEKPSYVARSSGNRFASLPLSAWNDLDVLCRIAIHQDPEKRYKSVEALTRDIDHYLRQEPLEAQTESVRYRVGKFVRRNRTTVLTISLAAAVTIFLIVFFTVRLAEAKNRATREAAATAAMNRFLSDDLLGHTDPFRSSHAKEDFADVVSQASPQIDSEFAAQPLLAARLHETLAKAFDNRSDFKRARQEYMRADDLFRQAEGPLSQEAVLMRLQRASLEARSFEPGSMAVARSLLQNAESSLSEIPHPQPDLAVWNLVARGVIGVLSNDASQANLDLTAALQAAQSLREFDALSRIRIEEVLAYTYVRLGKGEQAEQLLHELIDDYSKVEGSGGARGLRARAYLVESLLIQHKYAETIREADLLYPLLVTRLGESHEAPLSILGARAAAEGSLGEWKPAIRDDLAAHAIAVRKQGSTAFYPIAMLSDAGLSQCRASNYAEGEANARQAFEQSRRAFGPRNALTQGTSYAFAICLIGLRQTNKASVLLDSIDPVAVMKLTGDSSVPAGLALAKGEIAYLRGDYATARQYVKIATPEFERADADFGPRQQLHRLQNALHIP